MNDQYWQAYRQRTIAVTTDVEARNERVAVTIQSRLGHSESDTQRFFRDTQFQQSAVSSNLHNTVEKLTTWSKLGSWKYCNTCFSLHTCQMTPSMSMPRPSTPPTCPCKSALYTVPKFQDWPVQLLLLTKQDARFLSLYDVHIGNTAKVQHGYRAKDGMFRITLKPLPPLHTISAITDEHRRTALLRAYDWLMSCPFSPYKTFVQMRERNELLQKPNFSTVCNEPYLECAIWPVLYWRREWCESSLTGNRRHASMKRAFCVKAMCNIMDYGENFEIIRFQYDRWIFKTITGAIETAKKLGCSPARALDTKHFSPTYWQWQHCYLIDCTAQLGLPDVFITISPYEWTFPQPTWFQQRMSSLGCDQTDLGFWETMHIAHILQEYLRGYICGQTKYTWRNSILGKGNVITYFYRFEFQRRGTLHAHLIVWLRDRKKMNIDRLAATIHTTDEALATTVYRTQRSNQRTQGISVSDARTHFDNSGQLIFTRSDVDQTLNIRAYIDSVLLSLQSSMDFQMGNSRGLLLNYVAGYVTKYKDSFLSISNLLAQFDSHSMAIRQIKTMTPSEPEISLALTNTPLAYTSATTKKYLCPVSMERAQLCQVVAHYMDRPGTENDSTLLHFMRKFYISNRQLKRYQTNKLILVGCKLVSPTNDTYFFQDALLHTPFRSLQALAYSGPVPEDLHMFSYVVANRFSFWIDENAISRSLELYGHKQYFIDNTLSMVRSLWVAWRQWRNNLLSFDNLRISYIHPNTEIALNLRQFTFVDVVMRNLNRFDNEQEYHSQQISLFLLKGQQGTGKTACLLHLIAQAIDRNLTVLLTAPTGMLTTTLRSLVSDNVTCETVHSAFHLQSPHQPTPTVNWSLKRYHLIIIDEASMLSTRTAHHIISSLRAISSNATVVFCGDKNQLQPFGTDSTDRHSCMQDPTLLQLCHTFNLIEEQRTQDNTLREFLRQIIQFRPSTSQLSSFTDGLVLLPHSQPTDEEITAALQPFDNWIVLTHSNRASARINSIVTQHKFSQSSPLDVVQLADLDEPPQPVYHGHLIRLTENRDKRRGFVNGRIATVSALSGHTFLVQTETSVLRIYPLRNSDHQLYYPFLPSYALTVHKCQGQTLSNAIIWFDTRRLPGGLAYVAISRVRRRQDLRFLTEPTPGQF